MEQFAVDTTSMWKNRPLGVSGLLRIKNDEEFIQACVDSCIDALDELIITYNDCTDNSEEVIDYVKNKYPNKIKVYKYLPHIQSSNLTEDEYNHLISIPENSTQLLSNYYNYALSKSSYKYVMKIDADQIYYTKSLVELCNAYRGGVDVNVSIKDCFSFL